MIHDDFARTHRPRPDAPRERRDGAPERGRRGDAPAGRGDAAPAGDAAPPRRVGRRGLRGPAAAARSASREAALAPASLRPRLLEGEGLPIGVDALDSDGWALIDDLDPGPHVAARHAALTRLPGVPPIPALVTLAAAPTDRAAPPTDPAPQPAEEAAVAEPPVARTAAQPLTRTAGDGNEVAGHAVGAAGRDGPGAPVRGWFLGDRGDPRGRGAWLLLAFVAMSMAIGWKLVDVQVRQASSLGTAAARQHLATVTIPAHRGRILDSNGRLLASDVPLYAVYADPGVIPPQSRHDDAIALAPILAMGTQKLDDLLNQPGDYVPIAHGVTDEQRQRIATLGIYGILAVNEDRRTYEASALPGASLASNLLGYVDHDGHGQYGVESYYDAALRGTDGVSSTVRDLAGNPIVLGGDAQQPAHNGDDLQLGIDSRIQYYAEQALATAVTQSGAESGSVLVMDTSTGSLRAMADYPTYDANAYADADPSRIRDLGISGLYEPGSVMKLVTFAGGLQKNVIQPQEQIDEGEQVIDGYRIHDWDGRSSHGRITFQWVLDDSLNNGAIQVMSRVGRDGFYSNLLRFGVGSPTGVDLAGEVNQPLRQQSTWSAVDYATASFGQQVVVTPIEMLAAVNAIANGGVWVQPHAVEAIVDPAGGQRTELSPATRTVMSPQAAATLRQMMVGVVEDKGASGFLAKIPLFKNLIGGKTGTASVPENGAYGKNVIASFTGFLPATHPRFTMLVVIRKPQHCTSTGEPGGPASECEGAYVAAPVFRKLSQLIIDDWKITP